MGLMDIAQSMLGGNQTAGTGNLIGTILQALNDHPGGLDGVLRSFQQGGLAEAVNSWIGTGPNTPISGDDVQNTMGGGVLQDLAAKLGVSPETAGTQLSQLLPEIVNHLTPNGEVPEGGLASAGFNMLRGMLANRIGV